MQSALIRRSIAIACAAALFAAGCGHYVDYPDPAGPRYEGAFSARRDPEPALRIVTFNIQYARHVDRAIALLAADPHLRDADVLCLQEMDAPGTRRIAEALGMHWLYFPAVVHPKAGHDFGNALLARDSIRDARKLVLPHLARIAHSERIATAGTIDVGGRPVRCYSVHLAVPFTVSGRARRDQLQAVLDDARASGLPAVVAGDMNSHGMGAVAEHAGFVWASRRVGSTAGWFDADHVFLYGARLVAADSIGAVHDRQGASDHRPVWAVLALDSLPAPGR